MTFQKKTSHPTRIVELDHIGIAVKLPAELQKLFSLLGLTTEHTEDVPQEGVRTYFLPISAENLNLELLEPLDPKGTVARFLEKRGPGIHHLSFRVEKGKLDDVCRKLGAEGYRLIYDAPRPGAHRMRVNFIHPATAGGLLIELMEPAG